MVCSATEHYIVSTLSAGPVKSPLLSLHMVYTQDPVSTSVLDLVHSNAQGCVVHLMRQVRCNSPGREVQLTGA